MSSIQGTPGAPGAPGPGGSAGSQGDQGLPVSENVKSSLQWSTQKPKSIQETFLMLCIVVRSKDLQKLKDKKESYRR